MKVFFDTEFIDNGKTIELISIGLICENERTYYAESSEIDLTTTDKWIQQNVIPNLEGPKIPREHIAIDIQRIIGDRPEFWSYYASYDWVVLCQLYGKMINIPTNWPLYVKDLKLLAEFKGNPKLPKQKSSKHHALNDALWLKEVYEFLKGIKNG